jgi:hypothetical protein
MLTLADVMDLFANEFTSLRARGFARAFGSTCALDGLFLGH